MGKKIAIIGATGLVGQELIKLLNKRKFPLENLELFASEKSRGLNLKFKDKDIEVDTIGATSFEDIDIAFFAAGKAISQRYIPQAVKSNTICIDLSSAYRMDKEVPLVIPEINPHHLLNHKNIIASPNCTTSIMLIPLYPLHQEFKIKRIVASTYQAASGGGRKLIEKLLNDTKNFLSNKSSDYSYGFNLYLHDSPLNEDHYSEEEVKMQNETHKILEDPTIRISSTCVRVPVLRAHSISLNVEFRNNFSFEKAYSLLKKTKGLSLFENFSDNRFPTPFDATEQNNVYCGRIRLDTSQKNTLELWVVGDQLLKGAALNAVQIAEDLSFK